MTISSWPRTRRDFLIPLLASSLLAACGGGGGGGGGNAGAPAPLPPAPAGCLNASGGECLVLAGTSTLLTSESIPPASGGTATVSALDSASLEGTRITIPAGALTLSGVATLRISEVTGSDLPADVLVTDISIQGEEGIVHFAPDKPAEVAIKYTDAYRTSVGASESDVNDTVLKVVVMDPGVAPQTLRPKSIDPALNLVTTDTPHLSYFAVLGYSEATLKGRYTVTEFGHLKNEVQGTAPAVGQPLPMPKGYFVGQGYLDFDGAGHWSHTPVYAVQDGVTVAGFSDSGTYTITSDGLFSLTIVDNGVPESAPFFVGQVLAGGSLFAGTHEDGESPAVIYGMLQVQKTYTKDDVVGTYVVGDRGFDLYNGYASMPSPGSPLPGLDDLMESSLNRIRFNSDDTFEFLESTYNKSGFILMEDPADLVQGSYRVEADGKICIQFTDDEGSYDECIMRVLAGGKALTWAGGDIYPDGESYLFAGFGVKVDEGAIFNNAAIKGTYTVLFAAFERGEPQVNAPAVGGPLPQPKGHSTYRITVVANGDGTCNVIDVVTNLDSVGSHDSAPSAICSYSVESTGKVTFHLDDDDEIVGQVSADGSTFVMTNLTPGNSPEMAIGLLR